ncbi:MAG: enoyl-CoA hydratase/isomerase family protein [Solirubrobacteraceae bacterium]
MSTVELETVDLKVQDRVAWVTLNRPEALNAWTRQLGVELGATLDRLAEDPEVRAIVITGAGRAFSSGADLKAGGEVGADGKPDVGSPLREVYNPLMLKVRTIPKPVIGAVNGAAVGIGCSLALACDMLIASESAYFLLAFVNIGLSLDGGASALLPALVGHARAFEIAYKGERLPAAKALEWGIVNQVVPGEELLDVAGELARRFAAGPPGSYAGIKRTINAAAYNEFAAQLELETVEQEQRARSADFVEGVLAFMQKRPAQFTGE